MRNKLRRLLAFLLTAVMLAAMSGIPVYAVEDSGQLGISRGHEHSEDCYTIVIECNHEHDEDCYPQDDIAGNKATPANARRREPENCPHSCSEESGCITKVLDCPVGGAEDAGLPDCNGKDAEESTEQPEEKPGAPRKAARAGDTGINMNYSGFVFAQGVPIVIRQNGSITSIYNTEGNLLSGGTDVSNCNIYGGWYAEDNTASTSVTMESGTVKELWGGNFSGEVEGDTNVTVKGGTVTGAVYGGGNQSEVTGTANVTFEGSANARYIYGGGYAGAVKNTHIELNGSLDNKATWVYAGGGVPTKPVEYAEIVLGVDWSSFYQVNAGSSDQDVMVSKIRVQNYKPAKLGHLLNIYADASVDSTIVVEKSSGGPNSATNDTKFDLCPSGIKNIVVEYGEVNIMGSGGSEKLELDSLDIKSEAKVRFQDWGTINIGTFSGSGGQILFPAQFVLGSGIILPPAITVDQFSITSPLTLKAEGTGWTEEALEKCVFFQGAGVNADVPASFFSEGYDVILQEIPGGNGQGIYLQPHKDPPKPEGPEAVYISKHNFNQSASTYGGTLSITVGVAKTLATADRLELIPNARLQIRGSNSQDAVLAEVLVDGAGKSAIVTYPDGTKKQARVDVGYISFELPVNAALFDTRTEGLYLLATAPDFDSSRAQLLGPSNETAITINSSSIELLQTIPEPAFESPVESRLEDGAFYTADVLWRPDDNTTAGAFQLDRDFWADIVLTPKEGYWLSPESIGDTVVYDGKEVVCVFTPNGAAILKRLKSVRFQGHTVSVISSPAEGGAVTGDGRYPKGAQVTVTAAANSGYHFVRWTEDGKEVSANASYTFTITSDRTLAAVFDKNNSGGNSGSGSGNSGGSSGGGSSSGGSGSYSGDSSMIERPNPEKPKIPATSQTKPVIPDAGGNAAVDNGAVQSAISAAKNDAKKNGITANGVAVVIPIIPAAGQDSFNVTINAQTLNILVQEDVKRLEINIEGVIVEGIDTKLLKWLDTVSANGDLILRVKQETRSGLSGEAEAATGTRPVYDLSLVYTSGGIETPVTDLGGYTITVRLPYAPAKEEQAGNLYAVYVDGAGKVEWLTKSSYDPDLGAVIFETGHFSLYGIGYKNPVPSFTDITGHWAADNILFAASRGLLSGTSETTFSPNTGITRGMFATALGRLADINPDSYQTGEFTDVKADAYYAPYVNWAAQKGIVNGATATTFSPDANITREQMAVILTNYAKNMGYSLPATQEAVTFADNTQISSWAAAEVKAMQQAGILAGKDGNRFDPKGTATRAEAATVLRRFVEIVIDPKAAQGWVQNHSGSWQYIKNGNPATGWKEIDGKWYYFYANGSMAVNTVIDGRGIGPDGAETK